MDAYLKQLQQWQKQMLEIRAREREFSSADGAVSGKVNCRGAVLALHLDPAFLHKDAGVVANAIVAAIREACDQARTRAGEETNKIPRPKFPNWQERSLPPRKPGEVVPATNAELKKIWPHLQLPESSSKGSVHESSATCTIVLREHEASAADGAVRVKISARGGVLNLLKLDRAFLNQDAALVADAIVAAIKQARAEAKAFTDKQIKVPMPEHMKKFFPPDFED